MKKIFCFALCLASLAVTQVAFADDADIPNKPWKISTGVFELTDDAGLDVDPGWMIKLGYGITPDKEKKSVELFLTAQYRRFEAHAGPLSATFETSGLMLETVFYVKNAYLGGGAGYMELSTDGISKTDFTYELLAGVYFNEARTYGIEVDYINGDRPGNTQLGFALVGRF